MFRKRVGVLVHVCERGRMKIKVIRIGGLNELDHAIDSSGS